MLFEEFPRRRPELQDYPLTAYMLPVDNLPFKLTKSVNGYFSQSLLTVFLKSLTMLEILELHHDSGELVAAGPTWESQDS